MSRPSVAEIDLKALRHNYQLANALAPNSRNMAVVKANAYGHGAIPVARALADLAPAFAVACLEEALELRRAGITRPILLLEGFFQPDELAEAVAHDLWLLLENHWQIETLLNARLPSALTVWLKVDTGMHRLGIAPEDLGDCYQKLSGCAHVQGNIVLATHFSCADELENQETRHQITRFKNITAPFNAPLSMANSPALLGWKDSHSDWNRPGYMLYGNSPFPTPVATTDALIPVMGFRSRVMSLRMLKVGETVGYGATWRARRATRLAVIPAGYGDGYPRITKSGAPVMVNGQIAPLAGRVSMDLITVDVTDIDGVSIGSEVELWGKKISVEQVARHASSSGYELLTRIPGRLPRIYQD